MSLALRVSALATATANYLRDTVLPRVQPAGGTAGQVLTKTSATNYASSWQTPATGAATAGTRTLGYTSGKLTTVTGPGAATKSLTYTSGVLTQVQSISGGVTTTKTLAYTSGVLTGITVAIA